MGGWGKGDDIVVGGGAKGGHCAWGRGGGCQNGGVREEVQR
jgi:hypothetical protein